MKGFLTMAALVVAAIWVWSKMTSPTMKTKTKTSDPNSVPVDTGTFFGPNADPQTGAYLAPGDTVGAVAYQTQPGAGTIQ